MAEIEFKEIETVDGFKRRDKSFIAKVLSYQVVPKGENKMQVLQIFFDDDETPLELLGLDRPNPEGKYSSGYGIGAFMHSIRTLKQNPVKVLAGRDGDNNYVVKFEPNIIGNTLSLEYRENKYTKDGQEKISAIWKVIGVETIGSPMAGQATATTAPKNDFIEEWKEALVSILPDKEVGIIGKLKAIIPEEKKRQNMNAVRRVAFGKLIEEGFMELKDGIYSLK